MNLIYLNLLILIQSALSLENYFKNSIIRTLRDKRLEFTSDLRLTLPDTELNFTENYSFNSKSGIFKHSEISNDKKLKEEGEILYLNNVDEFYKINQNKKKCISKKGYDNLIDTFLSEWIPDNKRIINKNKDILLGPNSLIIYLFDTFEINKEAIKCEDFINSNRNNPKKCTIEKNESDDSRSFKIEYYFENRDEFTMFPFLIKTFDRFSSHSEWISLKELKYLNFKPNFDSKSSIVNLNLPIGVGCKRINPNKYPMIRLNYDADFELNFNVSFNYLNKYKKFNTLNYTNIMRVQDNDYRLSLNDGDHELDGLKIRTLYDRRTGVYFDNYLNDTKICKRYHQKSKDDQINWYYIGNLFANHPKFFYAENNIWVDYGYSYLGEYKLDGINTIVFENVFSNFNKQNKSISLDRNKNNFYSDYLISTHYYPKDKKYWKSNPNNKNIPLKIEMRLFDDDNTKEIGNLSIRFTDFKPFVQNIEFDISKCIKNLNLANQSQVTFIFNGSKENIDKFKDNPIRIDKNFRNNFMFVAPHRIGNVNVHTDDKAIYIDFDLFNAIDTRSFFEEEIGQSFLDRNNLYKNIELEECSRYCVEMKNCASYSFNKLIKTCSLWIDAGFDYEMEENGKYDWSKLPLIDNKNSLVGKKLSRYTYGKHASIDELIKLVKQFIKRNEFELIFFEEGKYIKFKLIDFKVKNDNKN